MAPNLLRALQRLLSPPTFPGDDDRTSAAVMIHYGILFGLFANLLAIPSMIAAKDPWWRIAATESFMFGALAGHLFLLRRGFVRTSGAAFAVLAWAILAAVNSTAGGVLAPGYSTHLVLIISVGFIFGGRGAFAAAAASTLLGLAFLALHQRGLLPPPQVENTAERHWMIVSMNFVAAAAVLSLMVRRFRQIIAEGRRELLERQEAERRLERHQAQLGDTIRERTDELARANRTLLEENAERRRAEEALRRERDLIGDLMEASPAGIMTLDPEGRVTFANAAAGRILGLDRGQIGRDGHVPPGPGSAAAGGDPPADGTFPAAAVLAGVGPVRDAHIALRTCDGRGVLLNVNATPLSRKGGGPGGLVLAVEDITERSRTEQELLKAQKLESVGLLAGGIAHDFNNLLTVILGSVSLARTEVPPGPGAAEDLEHAEQAAQQARELTQQLLTFARGGAPILQSIDVGETARGACQLTLRGTNVRGEFTIPEGLWAVRADEGQISQVFHNLARNACQAMPDGGTLHVTAANAVVPEGSEGGPAPGSYVLIQVRDHGTGILPETLPRIFDPYFTTKERGSGLGLAIVYSVVRRHGGHLAVESSVGSGTTFSIHLPAAGSAASVAAAPEAAAIDDVPGSERILVMDDDAQVRRLLERALGALGYAPEAVADGAAAVEAYRAAREAGRAFAAVILDLTVPGGVGGAEAMRRLRAIDPDVRAVVCSGYSDDPVMAAYAEHGFRGVLAKPFRPSDLHRVLRQTLA